ncbi:MAG: large conductance mechanosensitive channel protein MscL [Lachnospiraceae bacterium]|nr:large conductance mechanosensitive channel protein MscL [Lachnospiraceae bacterium]MCR5082235.1 large conductance mechanosensitive channel protein MscL [Parasporobacterium sp.]
MKKFFGEFKEFIMKGNVMDLAVAVIIGAAFQGIITSLTDNIISPILGLFGGVNFDQLVAKIGDVEIGYGAFITAVINFVIMALVIFIMIKIVRAASNAGKKLIKKGEKAPEPTTKECPFCFSEINIKASRCPNCTSILDEKLAAAIKDN